MKLRWSRRAAVQLFEAAEYLEGERPGTGERLYASVDGLAALIKEAPLSFPREPHAKGSDIRRALVLRYGYWLIYRVAEGEAELLVLAFWPTRRRPEGWRRR